MGLFKKKRNARQENLDRLYRNLAVAQFNYENAVKHSNEGSCDNQEKWQKRAQMWLNQVSELSKDIEGIEANNMRVRMSVKDWILVGSSLVLPIWGTFAQWVPFTEKGNSVVARFSEKGERNISQLKKG